MSVLTLPVTPPPAQMSVGLVTAKNVLAPAFGGDDQEILRKGTRFALTFELPPITYSASMAWDDLTSEGDTVLMRVYQPGFSTGAPGAPLVNGGSQAGSSLVIDGLTPGYVIRKGQFLSVVTGGQRFLYRARADATANGSSQATVLLRTMLRRSPADNDVVEIAQPMIEGFVRDMGEIDVGPDQLVRLKFTVRERA